MPPWPSSSYEPQINFNGLDQLHIPPMIWGTGDGGPLSVTDALIITVNVNAARVITIHGALAGYEDMRLAFSNLSIADIDAAEGTGLVKMTLGVEHGTLTLAQTTGQNIIAGNGLRNSTMTFKGTMYHLGNINYRG